jgi:hypothetical protein
MLLTDILLNAHHATGHERPGRRDAGKTFSYRPQSHRLTPDGLHPFLSGVKRMVGALFGGTPSRPIVHTAISHAGNGRTPVYQWQPSPPMNLDEFLRSCDRKQGRPYPVQRQPAAPRAYLEPGALRHLTRHSEIDDVRIVHDPAQSARDARMDEAISRVAAQAGFATTMESGLADTAGKAWTAFVSACRKTEDSSTYRIEMRASLLGHRLPPRLSGLDDPVRKPTVEDFVDSQATALYKDLKERVRNMIRNDPGLSDFHGEKESRFLAARVLHDEGLGALSLKSELAARLRAREDARSVLYPL